MIGMSLQPQFVWGLFKCKLFVDSFLMCCTTPNSKVVVAFEFGYNCLKEFICGNILPIFKISGRRNFFQW